MGNVKIQHGQSILDIAIQECGGLESAFEVSRLNGIPVTADLPTGGTLATPQASDKKTAKVYANMAHKPATGVTDEEMAKGPRIFDDTFDQSFE